MVKCYLNLSYGLPCEEKEQRCILYILGTNQGDEEGNKGRENGGMTEGVQEKRVSRGKSKVKTWCYYSLFSSISLYR